MLSRRQLVEDLKAWGQLSEGQKKWITANREKFTSLANAILECAKTKKEGGGCHSARDVEKVRSIGTLLKNPTSPVQDDINEIAWNESFYLGVPITCTAVDGCDVTSANCTCKEFVDGKNGYIAIAVQVDVVREVIIKKGQSQGRKMAFLTVTDSTCSLSDVCVFSDTFEACADLLFEGNTVLLVGERDKKRDSFIVKNVVQLENL
jgi:DNA polymerase III alpha subunit